MLEGGASKIEAAYEVILKMIMDNHFTAGEVLSERALSARLSVSRTPIRAALNRLTYEGYVDMKAESFSVVAELGLKDIIELYELREALECKAVELFVKRKTGTEEQELLDCLENHKKAVAASDDSSARKYDDEMHLLIAKGSKNGRIYNDLKKYIALSIHSTAVATSYTSRYEHSIKQHEEVVECIIRNDAQAAASKIREHLYDSREFFKKICLFE